MDEPAIDLERLRQLSADVIGNMQQLRTLLDARAAALEECREVLEGYATQLKTENEQFSAHERELCERYESREGALAAREKTCADQEQAYGSKQEQLAARETGLQAAERALSERESASTTREQSTAQREQKVAAVEKQIELQSAELAAKTQAISEETARLSKLDAEVRSASAVISARSDELNQKLAKLTADQEAAARQKSELAGQAQQISEQKAALTQLAAQTAQDRQEVAKQMAEIRFLREACEARKREVDAAAESVAGLQKQLEAELKQLAESANAPPMRFVETQQPAGSGAAPGAGGLPQPPDAKPRGSAERFQKLCRDAKRKAIGS